MQRFSPEGILYVYTQRRTAQRKMEYLPHRGVAQIVSRHGVLRLGDLLRCAPTGDPHLRLCLRIGEQAGASQGQKERRNCKEFECTVHSARFTMITLSKSLF